jgi:5'-3' exonuclease
MSKVVWLFYSSGSMFVKQALEGEYPKFLRLYLDMCKRIHAISHNSDQTETALANGVEQDVTDSGTFYIK